MKKPMITFMALALAGAMAVPVFAADAKAPLLISENPVLISTNTETNTGRYLIQVNGKETDIEVCVMVPLRAIAEELGFTVTWNSGTILVDNGAMHTVLTIGQDNYIVTTSSEELVGMSAPFSLGVAPTVTNGVTYVPLSLFDALLGNKEGVITVDGSQIRIQTEEEASTQIANPFVDCASLSDAAEIAGFELTAPETVNGYSDRTIRAVKDNMIQVTYRNDEDEVQIRKAYGGAEISGDYNAYPETDLVTVGGLQVTMKGEQGKVSVATWEKDGYAFALSASAGMSSDQAAELAALVQ